jgi:O-antigen ligase
MISEKTYSYLRALMWLLVVVTLPALLYEKYFAKGYVHAVLLIGFVFAVYWNSKNKIFSRDEEKLILFGFVLFCYVLLGFFQQVDGLSRFNSVLDNYTKVLLPLALFSILYWLRADGFKILIYSLFLSVLIALMHAINGLVQDLPRGGGSIHGSPIIFADLVMLYGLLNGVLSVYFWNDSKRLKAFLFCAASLLGIAASLLSGTKGGLLVLLSLPVFVLPFLHTTRDKVVFSIVSTLSLLALVVLFTITDNVLKPRMMMAWQEIQQILTGDLSGGSLGYRIQIWKVVWQSFLENPIFGVGAGEFYSFKYILLHEVGGTVDGSLLRFKHAHNEYFTILSGLGLIGVALYFLFFKWLIGLFVDAAKSPFSKEKTIGFLGLITIVSYVDFSLSESFLSSHSGGAAFYFIITLLVYALNQSKHYKSVSIK